MVGPWRAGRASIAQRRRGLVAGAWAALLAAACSQAPTDSASAVWDLHRALQLSEEVLLGVEGEAAQRELRALRPSLEAELGRRVRVVDLESARPAARRVRVLVGPVDAPGLAGVLQRLGAERVGAQGLRWGGRELSLSDHALVVTLADPRAPLAPLTACIGHVGEALLRDLRPAWRPAWQLYEGAHLVEQGALDVDGGLPPSATPPAERPRDLVAARPLQAWIADDPALAGLQDDLEAARDAVAALLAGADGSARVPTTVHVRLWRDAETLARRSRAWSRYRVLDRESAELDLLVAPGLPDDARAAFAELVALRLAGTPAQAWLRQGLARWVSGRWWDRDLGEWAAHLRLGGLVPSVEELLAPCPRASPHQVEPLRGVLFGVLVESLGREELVAGWRVGVAPALEPLRQAFDRRLDELVARHRSTLAQRRTARIARTLARPFRHGVDLVAPPARADALLTGVGGRACATSLERVRALGADAVALPLSTYVLEAGPRSAIQRRRLGPAASVEDLELAAAAAAAHALGLDVLLRHDLWVAPSSVLAGSRLVFHEADWVRLFDAYERSLIHVGLLAELLGAEVLCLGAEQRPASQTAGVDLAAGFGDETARLRRRRWSDLIATARAAYTGGLTYAASWDGELAEVGFWPELDFVGLELFAPFAAQQGDDGRPPFQLVTEQLHADIARASRLADEQGKRLLVTAVGFPSTSAAWRDPEDPRGPADQREQARLLSSLLEAVTIWRLKPDELAGLYLWSWSADPRAGGPEDRGYTPQRKLGEAALERIFREP